jgi:hypothetical protein
VADVSIAASPVRRWANVYLRFAVAAGGTGSVTWTFAPSAVQFSLLRIK